MPHRFEASGDFVERLEGAERAAALPLDKIIPFMSVSGSDTIADLGSGTGYFSLPISKLAKQVVSLDVEPKMVRYLRELLAGEGRGDVSPVLADITALPIASGAVDRILAAFIYHEIQDPRLLLSECSRALASSGRLTVIDFQKRDTGFGPPISERVTPEEVIATASGLFVLDRRAEGRAYYQLEFAKP